MNATNPAFPAAPDVNQGLTKREYFAIMSLQGLLADYRPGRTQTELVYYAIEIADTLIKTLEK